MPRRGSAPNSSSVPSRRLRRAARLAAMNVPAASGRTPPPSRTNSCACPSEPALGTTITAVNSKPTRNTGWRSRHRASTRASARRRPAEPTGRRDRRAASSRRSCRHACAVRQQQQVAVLERRVDELRAGRGVAEVAVAAVAGAPARAAPGRARVGEPHAARARRRPGRAERRANATRPSASTTTCWHSAATSSVWCVESSTARSSASSRDQLAEAQPLLGVEARRSARRG